MLQFCMKKLYFAKIAFFICLISIEYLATTSRHFEVVELSYDKLNHIFAFAVLFVLLSAFKLSFTCKVVILFLFGLQIEIVQSFLPFRSFSFYDILADIIGIFTGFLINNTIKKIYDKIF